MSANQEIMDFALKSFMRVRDQEIEALKESHKKELVALKDKFEDEKRKMVQEIIDLELDNKELLKKVVQMTEQADAISTQRREIEDLKRIVDKMSDQIVTLRSESREKDVQLRRKNEEIECYNVELATKTEKMHQQEFQIHGLRKSEKEQTVEWLIGHEKSPKLQFPQCSYFLAGQAVQCFKKGQYYGSFPSRNGIPYLCTDKFLEILSETKFEVH